MSLSSLTPEKTRGRGRLARRWGMSALCFSATAVNYLDRANLGLAMPVLKRELGLTPAQVGLVLSGFFWTYAVMQLPAGWLVDRFGPRRIYAWAVTWWSVFTVATGFGQGTASLLGCRLLLGVGEAGAYPCNAKVTAEWFPVRERAFATSLFDSGSRVGAALSWPVVGCLIATWGWRVSFAVTGLLGIVWTIVWLAIYRDPRDGERPVPPPAQAPGPPGPAGPVSLLALLRHRTVLGMGLGFFCLNFAIYFFITWFPTYLVEARGFSLSQVGTIGAVPASCAVLGGWLGGFTSDALLRAGCSLNVARKSCLVGGMLLSSSIALAVLVRSPTAAIALFCLSYASLAFAAASVWSLPADVAPTPAAVGSIAGIQNFMSGMAGVLTTLTTGLLLALSHGSFVAPLVAGGVACLAGAAVYLFVVGKIAPLRLGA